MPIVIGAGVLGLVAIGIFLFAGAASASEGVEPGKRTPGKKKIVVKIPKKRLPVDDVDPPSVLTYPTPGNYYRIAEGDTGSKIALLAYGSERPTARFLAVANHPENRLRLVRGWLDWFLPRWFQSLTPPDYSTWTGVYTGFYAVIWLPFANEVEL